MFFNTLNKIYYRIKYGILNLLNIHDYHIISNVFEYTLGDKKKAIVIEHGIKHVELSHINMRKIVVEMPIYKININESYDYVSFIDMMREFDVENLLGYSGFELLADKILTNDIDIFTLDMSAEGSTEGTDTLFIYHTYSTTIIINFKDN